MSQEEKQLKGTLSHSDYGIKFSYHIGFNKNGLGTGYPEFTVCNRCLGGDHDILRLLVSASGRRGS